MKILPPLFAITLLASKIHALSLQTVKTTRRHWVSESSRAICAILIPTSAGAAVADGDDESTYSNPNIPEAPEERSGLIVLRVAEVAQFQGEHSFS